MRAVSFFPLAAFLLLALIAVPARAEVTFSGTPEYPWPSLDPSEIGDPPIPQPDGAPSAPKGDGDRPAGVSGVQEPPPIALTRDVIRQIRRAPDQFIERAIGRIHMLAPDGLLTRDLVDQSLLRARAERRARMISKALEYDINGDFGVTPDEIAQLKTALSGTARAEFMTLLLRADRNGDGALSQGEIADDAALRTRTPIRRYTEFDLLFAFDADGDGAVTPVEVSAGVARVIAGEVVSAGDDAGQPTGDGSTFPGTRVARVDEVQRRICAFPKVPAGADLIYIETQGGGALSPVALGDLEDRSVEVAALEILPGDTPLYLVVASPRRLIWKVSGAVGRVLGFVASAQNDQVGVVGMPAGRVTVLPWRDCPVPVGGPGAKAFSRTGAATVAAFAGRAPDRSMFAREIWQMAVPTGRDAKRMVHPVGASWRDGGQVWRMTEEGPVVDDETDPSSLRRAAERFQSDYPAGVADFAARDVYALGSVIPYPILPGNAGYYQLARSGKIRLTDDHWMIIDEGFERFPPNGKIDWFRKVLIAPGRSVPAHLPKGVMVIGGVDGACIAGDGC